MINISTSDPSSINMAQQEDNTQLVAMNVLTEFHRFPDLPPELRDAIWEYVCHQARVVELRIEIKARATVGRILNADRHKTYKTFPWRLRSSNGIPSILHTSQEARAVGMKHYAPEFSTKPITSLLNPPAKLNSPPSAYMNWKIDTISPILPTVTSSQLGPSFPCAMLYSYLSCLTVIRNIAVDQNIVGRVDHLTSVLDNNKIESLMFYHDDDAKPKLQSNGERIITDVRAYDPSRAVCISDENGVSFFKLVQLYDSISNWTDLFELVDFYNTVTSAATLIEEDPATEFKRPDIKLMLMAKNVTEKDLDADDDDNEDDEEWQQNAVE